MIFSATSCGPLAEPFIYRNMVNSERSHTSATLRSLSIDEAATEEAITYYERKTGHHRSRNAFEEYDRRSRRY